MSELTRRLLFGVPAALFFLWLVWRGGVSFGILTGVLALFTMLEMVRLFKKYKYSAFTVISIIIAIYIWSVGLLPVSWVVGIGAGIALLTLYSLFSRNRSFGNRWLASLICGTYAPLGFYLFYRIRELEPESAGLWLTLAVVIMVWCNDILAYAGGRMFGKRPMAPTISPNKTWEGFWSGFAGAAIGFILVWLSADSFPLPLPASLPLIVIIGFFGPLGDLLESRLKRLADMKDSSSLLPGHGGLFDRFDAFILAVPVVFLYLNWVL
ncbi:MAG: phosphatidate cytidylyltransferase [Balneolaceae bacterium]